MQTGIQLSSIPAGDDREKDITENQLPRKLSLSQCTNRMVERVSEGPSKNAQVGLIAEMVQDIEVNWL